MKKITKFKVDIKKLEEIRCNDNYNISLVSRLVSNEEVQKKFGKYVIVNTKQKVKEVNKNNITNLKIGDLYFNSDEVENIRKR